MNNLQPKVTTISCGYSNKLYPIIVSLNLMTVKPPWKCRHWHLQRCVSQVILNQVDTQNDNQDEALHTLLSSHFLHSVCKPLKNILCILVPRSSHKPNFYWKYLSHLLFYGTRLIFALNSAFSPLGSSHWHHDST